MSNTLKAKVTNIKSVELVNIVSFEFKGVELKMMSLNLDKAIKVGSTVLLSIKPSHIAIAKDFNGVVSYSNQLKCKIHSLEVGELLASIELDFHETLLESIITADSVHKMNLHENEEITALIKASEVSIMEVIDD